MTIDAVPPLVSKLYYRRSTMVLEVTYFNGLYREFCVELFDCKDPVDLDQYSLTRMQELSILNELEKFSLANWKKLNESIN